MTRTISPKLSKNAILTACAGELSLLIVALLMPMLALSSLAQTLNCQPSAAVPYKGKCLPRFEDFPVGGSWDQTPTRARITTHSERMIQTRLAEASTQALNFAGPYRFVIWGCGSECAAGAVIDPRTGSVFAPPLGGRGDGWDRWIISASMFEGAAIDFRNNSRLVVVKSGLNYSEARKTNTPDALHFVWKNNRFRQVS